jgi:hypothetical protein
MNEIFIFIGAPQKTERPLVKKEVKTFVEKYNKTKK